jgi:hypothetical protein
MIEMLDVLRVGGQSDVFITEYPLYQLDCDLHELDNCVIHSLRSTLNRFEWEIDEGLKQ